MNILIPQYGKVENVETPTVEKDINQMIPRFADTYQRYCTVLSYSLFVKHI